MLHSVNILAFFNRLENMASIQVPSATFNFQSSVRRIELRFARDNWQRAVQGKSLRSDRLIVELDSNCPDLFVKTFNEQYKLHPIKLQDHHYPPANSNTASFPFLVRNGKNRARFSDAESWELLNFLKKIFSGAEVDFQHSHAKDKVLD